MKNIQVNSRFWSGSEISSSHTFVKKIEKSMNLLPVCKLLSHTASSVANKKSMRLNSNGSSQSNRSTELQAMLLPCYGSRKPIFKAGKRFEYCGNIKLLTSFSLEKFQYI